MPGDGADAAAQTPGIRSRGIEQFRRSNRRRTGFIVSDLTTSLSTVHILVDDPDIALALCRDTLGLTVRMDVANGGFRWITLVTDSQPEIGTVL